MASRNLTLGSRAQWRCVPGAACRPLPPTSAAPLPSLPPTTAGDWVKEALATLGGKGGGKPTSAQGTGPKVGKVDEAMEAATKFAGLKL